MTGLVRKRLADAGIVLPAAPGPAALYMPTMLSGDHLYVSAQGSMNEIDSVTGTVGVDVDLATAQRGARLCGLNILAQLDRALDGDLDRVAQVVKLTVFVQVGGDFFDMPLVANGCSELLVDVFGERGRHARATIGACRLPSNGTVEVDAVVRVTG